MFVIDRLILIGALLLLVGIASSKASSRVGLPVLVLFLIVGMVAGSEGLVGIRFENYALAHGIGSLALAIILFDGGLRTPLHALRLVWKPALLLATVGVLLTALITGLAAAWILGVPLLFGMLLASIVASTDAAAVFAVLRSQGVHLKEKLAATLEIESGSNDPMAIFLTVGVIQVLQGDTSLGTGLLGLFVMQMGVGALVGLAVGRLAVVVINRINLGAAGLYPVLTTAFGLLSFGAAAALQGSGFLAVYIAGIVIGNSRVIFKRGTFLFHDGIAWISQIVMFIVLGLLSFPSELMKVAWLGLAVALMLILIARPVAVVLCLLPFSYSRREVTLISWVGLKGAVPIILATYPLLLGVPNGVFIFNVVFFVVLLSAITQGWSLPYIARFLRLQEPTPATPVSLEITSLHNVNGDIVEYRVPPDSRAAGKRIKELALPDGVVVAMLARGNEIIPPRGSTRIEPGDQVFVVLRPETRPLVDRVFSREIDPPPDIPLRIEFPFRGDTTVAELESFYGILLDEVGSRTLDEVMRARLGPELAEDASIRVNGIVLYAHDIIDGKINRVGLEVKGGVG